MNTIFWIMVGVFAVSFAVMGIEAGVYERMLDKTQDMQHTGVQIIKQIIMKYDGMCRIGRNVNNTRNFVDKIMLGWKVCGIRHDVLRRTEKIMMYAFAYAGITVSLYYYYENGSDRKCIFLAAAGVMMGLALKIWEITLDVDYKKEKLLVLLTDYLENQVHTSPKSESGNDTAQVQAAAAAEKTKNAKLRDKKKNDKKRRDEYEESLINEVLNEFLQ